MILNYTTSVLWITLWEKIPSTPPVQMHANAGSTVHDSSSKFSLFVFNKLYRILANQQNSHRLTRYQESALSGMCTTSTSTDQNSPPW